SNLSLFPINTIKIDRAFIMNIEHSSAELFIVKLIMGVAQQLQCETVAEGVETEQQHKKLTELGCDLIQGYYFSKPLPNEEYEKLLPKKSDNVIRLIS
ncbi:MAG: EAL domain-containing protein, partial [Pseudomonadota bacterium]